MNGEQVFCNFKSMLSFKSNLSRNMFQSLTWLFTLSITLADLFMQLWTHMNRCVHTLQRD